MWTGIFNLYPNPEGSASLPPNIVLNQTPLSANSSLACPAKIHPSWIFSSFLNHCNILENTENWQHCTAISTDKKCIHVVCSYDVKIASRGHFFPRMRWKIADQILMLGPSDSNLLSSGIPQLWLVDLQVTNHHADSRHWGERRRRRKTTNKMSQK